MPWSASAMAKLADSAMKQRAHKRYIVSGTAEIELNGQKYLGRVVSIGAGGLLVYTRSTPPLEAEIGVEFSLPGFDEGRPIIARGRVVWTQPGKLGVEFVEDPPGLLVLLLWLEKEHCCWSRTD